MTKLPKPALFDGITVSRRGKYQSTENGYTADQMRQYARDVLEEAALKCEMLLYSKSVHPGKTASEVIRAMKGEI